MMRQCGFISGNKHATGERDVDKGEACVCVGGQNVYGKSLYLPSSKSETALRK